MVLQDGYLNVRKLIFTTLQVGKEMLCLNQQSDAEEQASPGFSLLMELLRDDQ